MKGKKIDSFSVSEVISSKKYILYIFITLLSSLYIPINIFLTTQFIDISLYDTTCDSMKKILIYIFLVNGIYSIIKNMNIVNKNQYVQLINKSIGNQFLHLVSVIPSVCYEKKEFSNALNKIRNMYNQVFYGIVNTSIVIASILPAMIGLCVIIARIEVKLLLILLISSSLLSFLFFRAKKREVNLWGEAMEYFRNFRYFSSILTSKKFSEETRVYNSYGFISKLWKKNILNFQSKVRKGNNSARVSTGIIRIIEYALSVVILYMMIPLVTENTMTIGAYIALASALWEIANILDEGIISVADGVSRYKLFRKEERNLHDMIENCYEEKKDLIILDENFEFENLRVEHLSYRYPGESKYVLKDVSFEIEKGCLLGLVGINGSGKSTLIKLLLKLTKAEQGSIWLNNVNINEIDDISYRNVMSAVFQDVAKFELKLEEFVRLGNADESISFEGILEVADRIVGDKKLLGKMKANKGKIIGHEMPDSVDLSSGQWHMLSIIRAFAADTSFYIFDEPTADIDPINERHIYDNIFSEIKEKGSNYTGILVTHRMGSVRSANKIMVLNEGEIEEYGSHDELMQRKGTYSRLFNEQKYFYEEVASDE